MSTATPDRAELRRAAERAVDIREQLNRAVEDALRDAERAVLSAVTRVQGVIDLGDRQAASSSQLLQRLQSETGGINGLMNDQHRVISQFTAALSEKSEAQHETAQSALDLLGKVKSGASEVSKLARESWMLSLNAHIEAVQLGEPGRPFGVIAMAMKDLSDRIEETNTIISEATVALSDLLPEMERSCAELGAIAERNVAALFDANHRVAETSSDVRGAVGHLCERLDRSTQAMVHEAMEVVSQLQFEDAARSVLRGADLPLYELLDALHRAHPEVVQAPAPTSARRHEAPNATNEGGCIGDDGLKRDGGATKFNRGVGVR
jgi:methyl-accepting chemotaxis protein